MRPGTRAVLHCKATKKATDSKVPITTPLNQQKSKPETIRSTLAQHEQGERCTFAHGKQMLIGFHLPVCFQNYLTLKV